MKLLLVALLSVSVLAARGDDGWSLSSGAPRIGQRHPTIQMVSEVVQIEMGMATSEVHATFKFYNHGAKTSVTMGFPEECDGDGVDEQKQSSLNHFRTKVDGKFVSVHWKTYRASAEEQTYKAAWLKHVSFAKHQTRIVEVSYSQTTSLSSSGDRWFGYILKTGATWKQPIKKCTVILRKKKDLDSYSNPWLKDADTFKIDEPWKRVDATTWRVVLGPFTPKEDLGFSIHPGFDNVVINGHLLAETQPYRTGILRQKGAFWIALSELGMLYGRTSGDGKDWDRWTLASHEQFKGKFQTKGSRIVYKGHSIPWIWTQIPKDSYKEKEVYVPLKRLVELLGGQYAYDPKWDKITLSLPRPAK